MEKIEVSEGKANGTTRETLKGNKSGSLDGVCPGILQRLVNSQPCSPGAGAGLEGVPPGLPTMGWIHPEMNWIDPHSCQVSVTPKSPRPTSLPPPT